MISIGLPQQTFNIHRDRTVLRSVGRRSTEQFFQDSAGVGYVRVSVVEISSCGTRCLVHYQAAGLVASSTTGK
ncbi:hypothetical protein RMSM_06228 [Rhodopirellula maiorica SM1]|uniref:Uncharacterized protein n=1 Tax=Rhodopirellula maiorica SM1 TaxID=1265738 RepID=M5RBI2_9BACT|nr:hypothetical protein RMSM_06228 [Rhodopirellula maiorica SM1]